MQITKEQDILDQKFRKMVIDSIGGQENQARKAEAYRRYLCFKDAKRAPTAAPPSTR